jgi:hypothetical protein
MVLRDAGQCGPGPRPRFADLDGTGLPGTSTFLCLRLARLPAPHILKACDCGYSGQMKATRSCGLTSPLRTGQRGLCWRWPWRPLDQRRQSSRRSARGAVVLQARFNLITADPLLLGDSVKFIEAEVRPVVESLPGSLGMLLYTNPELGVAVLESFWTSRAALVQSGEMVWPGRREAVRRAVGTVAVERYRVPVFEREAPLRAGAGLRLTRMDVEPSRVEDAVESYGDVASRDWRRPRGSAGRCCWSTGARGIRSARPYGGVPRRWPRAAARPRRSGSIRSRRQTR